MMLPAAQVWGGPQSCAAGTAVAARRQLTGRDGCVNCLLLTLLVRWLMMVSSSPGHASGKSEYTTAPSTSCSCVWMMWGALHGAPREQDANRVWRSRG
jgi:hypothetical protein